jgi:hypothetical protein
MILRFKIYESILKQLESQFTDHDVLTVKQALKVLNFSDIIVNLEKNRIELLLNFRKNSDHLVKYIGKIILTKRDNNVYLNAHVNKKWYANSEVIDWAIYDETTFFENVWNLEDIIKKIISELDTCGSDNTKKTYQANINPYKLNGKKL